MKLWRGTSSRYFYAYWRQCGFSRKDLQKKYGEPTGQALLESALRHIDILDRLDFHEFKVSVKASNVFLTMDAYRLLSQQIDNPLHLV